MCVHALWGHACVASVHGISKQVQSNQSIKAPGITSLLLIIKGVWIIRDLVGALSRIKKNNNFHPEHAYMVHLHCGHEMFFSYLGKGLSQPVTFQGLLFGLLKRFSLQQEAEDFGHLPALQSPASHGTCAILGHRLKPCNIPDWFWSVPVCRTIW